VVISSIYNVSADFFYCDGFLRMSPSSRVYCCVPLCNQMGRVDPQINRVGFFTFLKDPNIRKQWLQKIRKDVGPNFSLMKDTEICLLHFCGQIPEKRKQMEDLSTCNENGCVAEDPHSVPVASTRTVDSSSLVEDDMVSNNLETSDHEMQEESLSHWPERDCLLE